MTKEEYNVYTEMKFYVEANPHRLSSWEKIAKDQIKLFYEDEKFNFYIRDKVLRQAENPPGPFTRFLYWFGMSCQGCGWGVMVDFSERTQQVYLVDNYYKMMHKWRDELNLLPPSHWNCKTLPLAESERNENNRSTEEN